MSVKAARKSACATVIVVCRQSGSGGSTLLVSGDQTLVALDADHHIVD